MRRMGEVPGRNAHCGPRLVKVWGVSSKGEARQRSRSNGGGQLERFNSGGQPGWGVNSCWRCTSRPPSSKSCSATRADPRLQRLYRTNPLGQTLLPSPGAMDGRFRFLVSAVFRLHLCSSNLTTGADFDEHRCNRQSARTRSLHTYGIHSPRRGWRVSETEIFEEGSSRVATQDLLERVGRRSSRCIGGPCVPCPSAHDGEPLGHRHAHRLATPSSRLPAVDIEANAGSSQVSALGPGDWEVVAAIRLGKQSFDSFEIRRAEARLSATYQGHSGVGVQRSALSTRKQSLQS